MNKEGVLCCNIVRKFIDAFPIPLVYSINLFVPDKLTPPHSIPSQDLSIAALCPVKSRLVRHSKVTCGSLSILGFVVGEDIFNHIFLFFFSECVMDGKGEYFLPHLVRIGERILLGLFPIAHLIKRLEVN